MIDPYTELQVEVAFCLGYVVARGGEGSPGDVLQDKLAEIREHLRAGASDRLNVIRGEVEWAIDFVLDSTLVKHLERARELVIDLQGHGPVEPE